MRIVRAHASETALMEIIVAIEDTLHKGSGELAPLIKPSDLIILNSGSTGGALFFVQIFRELGFDDLPTIIETSTLTYRCRAKGYKVEVPVKVNRVLCPSTLS